MTGAAFTLADLRSVDLFDDIDDEQLEQWVAVARPFDARAGELLIEHGVEPPGVVLLLDGRARSMVVDAGRVEPLGHQQGPTWIGAIAVLTEAPLGVRMEAETDCRVALIPGEDFRRMARAQDGVHRRVMQQVGPVMSRVTAIEQNRERLAALGTMAAGLAHELNNPAAAAQRAAAQMEEALGVMSSTIRRFVESGMEREAVRNLVALHEQALLDAESRTALDALDAADAEDELLDRLEQLGVPEPWRIVEPLASAGIDTAWLDRVGELAGEGSVAAIAWVAASLTARGLAGELQESTRRMSSLVTAIKSYAYMDRGTFVEVDLHEGIETTLVVLGHKLKHTSIEVVRHYDRSIPKLTVRGSELNQVWTNLLDNAIDALGDSGTITITTRLKGECALVDISDNGHGIPDELCDHVFESFFTTKEVGMGTGLGLATARSIIVDRHDGSMTLDSTPGSTTFHVSLPLTHS